MASVACIGECMVELRQAQGGQSAGHSSGQGGGLYSRGFGGDTLNTAVYLARLEVKVDYLTALGDDALSDEMIAAGLRRASARGASRGSGQAARPLHDPAGCEGRAPVLPLARQCGGAPADEFAGDGRSPQLPDELRHRLSLCDHALDLRRGRARAPVRGDQRARACSAPASCSTPIFARGDGRIAMSRARCFQPAFATADIVLTSTEDLLALYPGESHEQLMARIPSPSWCSARRSGQPAALSRGAYEVRAEPMTKPVVDTTAAGDSFAAAISRRGSLGPTRSRPPRPDTASPAS